MKNIVSVELTVNDVNIILANAGFEYSSSSAAGIETWVQMPGGNVLSFLNTSDAAQRLEVITRSPFYAELIAESHWRYIISSETLLLVDKLCTVDDNAPDYFKEYSAAGRAIVYSILPFISGNTGAQQSLLSNPRAAAAKIAKEATRNG